MKVYKSIKYRERECLYKGLYILIFMLYEPLKISHQMMDIYVSGNISNLLHKSGLLV